MSPADTRRNMLNIFIAVILVLVIIAAAYVFLSNPADQSIDRLTVDEVVESSADYLDSIISVEGFYYHKSNPEGEGVITAKIEDPLSSSSGLVNEIAVNHSGVNIILADEVKYRFTGTLLEDTSSPVSSGVVILIAEDIVRV